MNARSFAIILVVVSGHQAAAGPDIGAPIEISNGMANGGFPDRLDIELPSAPNGTTPSLAIIADHTANDGVLGQGFVLAGGSAIRRSSESGGVAYPGSINRFDLDGMVLDQRHIGGVLTSGYEPRRIDGSLLTYDCTKNVWTRRKSGWTWTYGSTGAGGATVPEPGPAVGATSCATAPNHTRAWNLARVEDPFGNAITYSYTTPALPASLAGTYGPRPGAIATPVEKVLSSITYADGAATIGFVYEERPDPHFVRGYLRVVRLKEIATTASSLAFSRYRLQYEDETADEVIQPLTDCNGSAVIRPALDRTVLRKIVRVGATSPHRVLRCMTAHHEPSAWESTGLVLPEVGGASANAESEVAIPIPTNLNNDGLTDLVMIVAGSDGSPAEVTAFTALAPFGRSVLPNTFGRATEWETHLARIIGKKAWSLTDLDGDHVPEILYGVDVGGILQVKANIRTGTSWSTETLDLDYCDFKHGQFVDIDGDGRQDLVIPPHTGDHLCASPTTTEWIREVQLYDNNVAPVPLAVPLEQLVLPSTWSSIVTTVCPTGIAAPDPMFSPFTAESYVASQARIADFNGDGIADIAYALYGCWELEHADDWQTTWPAPNKPATSGQNEEDWRPIAGSEYSRMFWGTGDGTFVDSGLSAGPPLAYEIDTGDDWEWSQQRLLSGVLYPVDLDRDGVPEVISTSADAVPLATISLATKGKAYQFAGLAPGIGWGLPTSIPASTPSLSIPGMELLSPGARCFKRSSSSTLGDFDGDGFLDVLNIEAADGVAAAPACAASKWCVTLRKSLRTASQGRVLSIDGESGGRTTLTWGSSAIAPNANPELPMAREVVTHVNGAEGDVSLVYAGATMAPENPILPRYTYFATPFAQVERENHRGGVDVVGFVTDAWAQGEPAYAARYRTNGSMEHVTVYLRESDPFAPYFSPVARQCDYAIGNARNGAQSIDNQAPTIDLFIDKCLAAPVVGGLAAVPSEDLRWPTASDLPVALPTRSAIQANTGGTFYRWPIPAALVASLPPVETAQETYVYPEDSANTPYVEQAHDWYWLATTLALVQEREHRDTTTTNDDRYTLVSQSQPDPAYYWYRTDQVRVTDSAGATLKVDRFSDFTGTYTPQRTEECGADGTTCSVHVHQRDWFGEVIAHTLVGVGTETWTYDALGETTSHVDMVGRAEERTYAGGRLATRTLEGATATFLYDALGRTTKETLTVEPASTAVETTFAYDDSFQYREDSSYLEPRVVTTRTDGKRTLRFTDGFGRVTKVVDCTASGTGCVAGTERVMAWTLYGMDGRAKVEAEPHMTTEPPVTTGTAHDGLGRAIVGLSPGHGARTQPSWNTTTITRGATWTKLTGPTGLEDLTLTSTLATLKMAGTPVIAGGVRSMVVVDALGRRIEEMGADGEKTLIAYDGGGRVRSVRWESTAPCIAVGTSTLQDCAFETTYSAYDPAGRPLTVIAPDGLVTTHAYDAVGRTLSITIDPVDGDPKLVTQYAYRGHTTSSLPQVDTIDESGATMTTTTDGLGRVIATSRLGLSSSTVWGTNGQPTSVTDENGRTTQYAYDTHGHVTTITHPDGRVSAFTFDGAGRTLTTTDPDGVVTRFEHTYSGAPLREVLDGTWTESEATYDVAGRVATKTVQGVHATYTYDGLSRIAKVERGTALGLPALLTTEVVHDSGDRVVSATVTAAGQAPVTTAYTYDAWGRLVTSSNVALGATSTSDLDVMGRVRFAHDAAGHVLETLYDGRGRPVVQEFPGGSSQLEYLAGQTYAGVGNLTLTKQTIGAAVTSVYEDSAGRHIASIDPLGVERRSTWNQRDLVAETMLDASGATLSIVEHTYDTAGRVLTDKGPYLPGETEIDIATYSYSSAGRLLSHATPEQTTTFTHEHGLMKTEAWADQVRTVLRADPAASWPTGETLSGTGNATRTTKLTRDALGRITRSAVTTPGLLAVVTTRAAFTAFDAPTIETRAVGATVEATTNWSYDLAGHPLTRTLALSTGDVRTTTWVWNVDGSPASITTPSSKVFGYEYDADGLVERITDLATTNYLHVTERDARAQPTTVEVPVDNTVRTFAYDLAGRPIQRTHSVAGVPALTWTAVRDPLGRITSETYDDGGVPWTNTLAYDGRGRLVREVRGKAHDTIDYAWTAGGNLTTKTITPLFGAPTVMTATYNGQKLTKVDATTLVYDAWQSVTNDQHGNTLTYSADGQLRTAKGAAAAAVTVLRDAEGLPVAHQQVGAGTRLTTWGLDAGELPLEVREASGHDRTYVGSPIGLLGVLDNGAFVGGETTERGTLLRSGSELVTSATAFGHGATPPVNAADERFLFANLETVAGTNNLHLARHRSYDTQTGRFQQADPLGLAGDRHRFLYANGDPVSASDPLGLAAESCLAPPPALGGTPTVPPIQMPTFQGSNVTTQSVTSLIDEDVAAINAAWDCPSGNCGSLQDGRDFAGDAWTHDWVVGTDPPGGTVIEAEPAVTELFSSGLADLVFDAVDLPTSPSTGEPPEEETPTEPLQRSTKKADPQRRRTAQQALRYIRRQAARQGRRELRHLKLFLEETHHRWRDILQMAHEGTLEIVYTRKSDGALVVQAVTSVPGFASMIWNASVDDYHGYDSIGSSIWEQAMHLSPQAIERASFFAPLNIWMSQNAVPALVGAGIDRVLSNTGRPGRFVKSVLEDPVFQDVSWIVGVRSLSRSTVARAKGCGGCLPEDGTCFTADTAVWTSSGTRPIAEIAVGDRVLADDPSCAERHLPDDALAIDLAITPPGREEDWERVTVIRSAEWLASTGLATGPQWIDVGDAGEAGWARVTQVVPAPREQPGDGCLVLMTVRHEATSLVALVAGGESIEVTESHPLYVIGRGWQRVSELHPGDLLASSTGPQAITSLASLADRPVVFNLEVDAAHQYRVGANGLWAHNTCTLKSLLQGTATARIEELQQLGKTGGESAVFVHPEAPSVAIKFLKVPAMAPRLVSELTAIEQLSGTVVADGVTVTYRGAKYLGEGQITLTGAAKGTVTAGKRVVHMQERIVGNFASGPIRQALTDRFRSMGISDFNAGNVIIDAKGVAVIVDVSLNWKYFDLVRSGTIPR